MTSYAKPKFDSSTQPWSDLFLIQPYIRDPTNSCVAYDAHKAWGGNPLLNDQGPLQLGVKKNSDGVRVDSLRLESKTQVITPGTLLVAQYDAIPGLSDLNGPKDLNGYWPALWTADTSKASPLCCPDPTDPSKPQMCPCPNPNWPKGGEIDLIETAFGKTWNAPGVTRFLQHAAVHSAVPDDPNARCQLRDVDPKGDAPCRIDDANAGCVASSFPPGGYDPKGIVALEVGQDDPNSPDYGVTLWKCPYAAADTVFNGGKPDTNAWAGLGCSSKTYLMNKKACFGDGPGLAHNLIVNTAVGGGPFDQGGCSTVPMSSFDDSGKWQFKRIGVYAP